MTVSAVGKNLNARFLFFRSDDESVRVVVIVAPMPERVSVFGLLHPHNSGAAHSSLSSYSLIFRANFLFCEKCVFKRNPSVKPKLSYNADSAHSSSLKAQPKSRLVGLSP